LIQVSATPVAMNPHFVLVSFAAPTPQINSLRALPTIILAHFWLQLYSLSVCCNSWTCASPFSSTHVHFSNLAKSHHMDVNLHSIPWTGSVQCTPTRSPLTAILQSRPPLLPSPVPMLNNSRRNYSLLTSCSLAPKMPSTIWFHNLCFQFNQPSTAAAGSFDPLQLLKLPIHNYWSIMACSLPIKTINTDDLKLKVEFSCPSHRHFQKESCFFSINAFKYLNLRPIILTLWRFPEGLALKTWLLVLSLLTFWFFLFFGWLWLYFKLCSFYP
jgi:hypothetical protein